MLMARVAVKVSWDPMVGNETLNIPFFVIEMTKSFLHLRCHCSLNECFDSNERYAYCTSYMMQSLTPSVDDNTQYGSWHEKIYMMPRTTLSVDIHR